MITRVSYRQRDSNNRLLLKNLVFVDPIPQPTSKTHRFPHCVKTSPHHHLCSRQELTGSGGMRLICSGKMLTLQVWMVCRDPFGPPGQTPNRTGTGTHRSTWAEQWITGALQGFIDSYVGCSSVGQVRIQKQNKIWEVLLLTLLHFQAPSCMFTTVAV